MRWKTFALGAALAAGVAGSAPAAAASGEVAASAEEIRPLLIGATVPSVELRTLEDETVDLQKVVLGKRSILLFYRGGW